MLFRSDRDVEAAYVLRVRESEERAGVRKAVTATEVQFDERTRTREQELAPQGERPERGRDETERQGEGRHPGVAYRTTPRHAPRSPG